MPVRRESANESVRRGAWGEDAAVCRLRCEGYEILERNARPVRDDRRLEIDVVAYDPRTDALVFVEVKQHKRHVTGESRIRSVGRAKRRLLRIACNAWRRHNRWTTGYRFDVVEVYGEPGGTPEIDHVRSVNLFTPRDRFVRWG